MALGKWTEEEKDYLESLAGLYPLEKICKKMRAYQERNGLPVRSQDAIKVKITKMGVSRKRTLDNFNLAELARVLGVNRARTNNWYTNYRLPIRRHGHSIAVPLEKFREWAYANPRLFADIDPERLNWLMDDAVFCQSTQELCRPTPGRKLAVQRLDTGEIYSSVAEASRSVYASNGVIGKAIARGGKGAGVFWRYVEDLKAG